MSISRESEPITDPNERINVLVLTTTSDHRRWESLDLGDSSIRVHTDPTSISKILLEETFQAVVLSAEVIAPNTAASLVETVRALSPAGVVIEGKFQIGQRLPGNADAVFTPNADSQTFQVAIDAAVRQARSRFAASADRAFVQSLLDSGQTLVLSIDSKTRIREFNRACEIVTGRTLGEVYGRPLHELLVKGDDRGLSETMSTNRGHIFPSNLELEFCDADGESHLVECTFSPFFDEIGDTRLAVVTGIEVTDQRRFAAALRESEEAFRNLVEASPDAAFVLSLSNDEWLYANPAALRLLEIDSLESLRGQRFIDIVDPADHETSNERLAEVLRTGTTLPPAEIRLNLPNDSTRWVETIEIPVPYRGRDSILTIARDITERKEFTARMMQLDRMVAVGTLAAGVGHEINNPLAYLTSNIEFAANELKRTARDNPQAFREILMSLEEAQEGASRVRDIVRDLKDLSRAERDRLEPLDVEAMLESALNVAWHEIRNRAHIIRRFEPVPLVHGSGGRVRQLFVNLLLNAAQSMPEGDPNGRAISLEISAEGDHVHVSITDEGSGIPYEDQRRVYDPFFTTKPVGSGTGLGLTIVQRIIESVGGTTYIESELGVGTTVHVLFEAFTSEASEASEIDPSQQVPLRLLLLDDEPLIANSVRRALPEHSEVLAFSNGIDAIEHLEHDLDFDVVLCDLIMPNMSGAEFHAVVAERWPDLERRIVFMTGGAYTDSAAAFESIHHSRVLDKPFATWDLREALYTAAKA